MNQGATGICDMNVPSDDGAIARALTEAEEKLAAWAAIVTVDELAPSIDPYSLSTDIEETWDEPDGPSDTLTETPEGNEEAGGAVNACDAADVDPTSAAGHGAAIAADVSTVTPFMNAVAEGVGAGIDEDESLLRALNPEMANAVRVQYRLFDGRKSVRELIDSYQPSSPQRLQRSWWERMKA